MEMGTGSACPPKVHAGSAAGQPPLYSRLSSQRPASGTNKDGLYIRPQKGITEKIACLADTTKSLSATVDGPYGTIIRPRPEAGYDTVVLVASGGGFAGLLPHLQHLTRCIAPGQSSVKKVKIHTETFGW
ncbi:hypothetical protein ACJZ2D_008457 [Fusarium nematophilum]